MNLQYLVKDKMLEKEQQCIACATVENSHYYEHFKLLFIFCKVKAHEKAINITSAHR